MDGWGLGSGLPLAHLESSGWWLILISKMVGGMLCIHNMCRVVH